MPRKDGTGPASVGKGSMYGNKGGTGRGRIGNVAATGVQGYCVCPKCNNRVKHDRAEPCNTVKCPKCDTLMVRE